MVINISDLPPKMQKQALKQICEEKARKQNKLHAQKRIGYLADGSVHKFDSAKEARVYGDLAMREKAGEIENLQLQVEYELIPKQKLSSGRAERSVKYIADFVYTDKADGKTHVVDVKGYRGGATYAIFVIKRKLMLQKFGIEVEEV